MAEIPKGTTKQEAERVARAFLAGWFDYLNQKDTKNNTTKGANHGQT